MVRLGRVRSPLFAVLLLSLSLLLLNGCNSASVSSPDVRIKIAATLMPVADIARQIGGEKVEVVTILPPGASPHTYEPSPAQIKAITGTALILKVGAGLDDWVGKVATSAAPQAKVLTLSQGLELLPAQHEHAGAAFNPHIWLDPILVRDYLSPAVAEALVELAPQEADYFKANLAAWQEKLSRLDGEIRSALAQVPQRHFISFHPAWSYFAARYNLIELETVEEKPGQEPTASHLAGLVERARERGKPPILIEPQFNPQTAQVLAQEYGGRVYTVDPVGTYLNNYVDLMYYNLRVFVEALQGGDSKQ